MTFKDALSNFMAKRGAKKEKFEGMEEEDHMTELLEQKKKSANERELEQFLKREREEHIRDDLQRFRRKQTEEIKNANPINIPNVTKGGDNILKAKNIFSGNQNSILKAKTILKNNPNLLRNNSKLFNSGKVKI